MVAITDLGNAIFIQAKIKLALSTRQDSPLADGLEQAVRQYLGGSVPGSNAAGRAVDASRDAIILCTDRTAPATVRVQLAGALRRTASHPPGTSFGYELTSQQHDALVVAITHVRRHWIDAASGTEPTNEDLRSFLKCLHVMTLDLDDGRADQQAAIAVLCRTLPDPSQSKSAWATLVGVAQQASENREWRDRASLVRALSQDGLRTSVASRFTRDIELLRDRSAGNLAQLRAQAHLPTEGGIYITRPVAKTLRTLTSRAHTLVVGDAGAGKSAVLQDLAASRQTREDVVVLLASDVAGANKLHTSSPLPDVLRGWDGPPGLLVIDGVDALRGSEDRETLSNTVSTLSGTRWQVVASARSFDTRNSQPLRNAFAGSPPSAEAGEADGRLPDVRHLLVGDLTDSDLEREIASATPLARLLTKAPPDLRRLLRNPFNLRLAAELAESLSTSQHAELLRVRSRVQLLAKYWDWRVRSEDAPAREALLKRLVLTMVAERRLQVEQQEPTVWATDSAALEALLSHGVLNVHEGPIPGVGRILGFAHNILFDYATAIYLLYDPLNPDGLVRVLDQDPTLPLIARPSFDLLVDMLWQARSTGAFWARVLALSASEHVLASLAVASRIVNLATEPHDLLELATPEPTTPVGMSPRQQMVKQIVSAARASAVLTDPSGAVAPLAHLALALSDTASTSYNDGALATDLLLALQARAPIASDQREAGDAERAQAIAAGLDACRVDPGERERLAGALVRQLENVIGSSIEVREAAFRLLKDADALAQWGGTVTMWFPGAALATLNADPLLAIDLAVVSMTFTETREDSISLGFSQVLPMNESRKQQATYAAYQLTESFPQFCSTNVVAAAAIICAIASFSDVGTDDGTETDADEWPMAGAGAAGWLRHGYGMGLDYIYEDEQKMLEALADSLLGAPRSLADEVLVTLVSEAHEGWVWAALMQNAADPARLCRILFSAFESGTLLVHPDTFTHAATLLKAAASEGTVPHHELEAAVRTAFVLVDSNQRSERIKDVLVGCLDAGSIANQDLADHLAGLKDEIPDIPLTPSMTTEVTDWSPVDSVIEEGAILDSDVETSARRLHRCMSEAGENDPASPEGIANLVEAFIDTHATLSAADDVPHRLATLVVDAACRLARDPVITPDHEAAPLIFAALRDGAQDVHAGRFLQ